MTNMTFRRLPCSSLTVEGQVQKMIGSVALTHIYVMVESPIGVSTGRESNQGDLGTALGSEI